MKKAIAAGVVLLTLGLGGCATSEGRYAACVSALDVSDDNQNALVKASYLTAQGASDALNGDYDAATKDFDTAQQLLKAVDVNKYNDYAKECRG